jgi:hypothetical protein
MMLYTPFRFLETFKLPMRFLYPIKPEVRAPNNWTKVLGILWYRSAPYSTVRPEARGDSHRTPLKLNAEAQQQPFERYRAPNKNFVCVVLRPGVTALDQKNREATLF